MTLANHLKRQRVKHIVSSYQLDGSDVELCNHTINAWLECYPAAWIELAIADTIAHHWATLPLPRGTALFTKIHERLQQWDATGIASVLSPDEFQHITGLNPNSVFEPLDPPSIARC
ncbi:hypothetical protein [Myxacorys almedinensis]|uniref:Uncharacterized protein n=1 Tax=Myxacorys almedinensis A TaxID=2690445 RepID=A0A8J7Z064_9CYAN|nr:hypothetical protein [Myxacorys almedinensis]NDJ15698.1 hypothetical protein [Myxacorys almedinensis A]